MQLTLLTAFKTPFPPNREGSLSRNSQASYLPVEAPEGIAAINFPSEVTTSVSTVGLPRESRISRAQIDCYLFVLGH